MELPPAWRCLPLMLILPLLLATAPHVTLVHAWVREPTKLNVVGGVENTPVTIGAWRSATEVEVSHRGALFDLDALIDTRDTSTTAQVQVASPTVLGNTAGWHIIATPSARLGLLTGDTTQFVVGFPRELQVPVTTAQLKFEANPPQKVGRTKKFDCVVYTLRASTAADAPKWEPPSYRWSFTQLGTQGHWTHLRGTSDSSELLIDGWVTAKDYSCTSGSGGGFGLSGSGGSSDGRLDAREVTLLSQTALYASPEATTPLVTIHSSAKALLLDDGSVRIKVSNKTQSLSLHGVFLGPNAKYVGSPQKKHTHGTGSSFTRNDSSPHVCGDAGVVVTPCYGDR